MAYFGTEIASVRGVGTALNVIFRCRSVRSIQRKRCHLLKPDVRSFSGSNSANFDGEIETPVVARQPFPKCQNGMDVTKVLNGPKNFNRNREFIYLRQYLEEPQATKLTRFIMANKSILVSISIVITVLGLATYVGLMGTTWEYEVQKQIALKLLQEGGLDDRK
ncbi:hypothetical protein BmR1_04g05130 [Babesia microti strain RI]|uniref:Uncharacterized protein n=1 Tax=Babesia microti (strain RI) TaxID=1133968 RepID=A0A1N6LXB6_BABMR|nr:hypothetical protein BmR1_04g05130 [Babesia microti strain RI]SIO73513.1 hypothetical protein BmR1_04g05130 [Babesia microti strain RI]|eukprot:XP_021337607.1 hypothetical protein BmR1_04g05130 [Babesia microti strain RI]